MTEIMQLISIERGASSVYAALTTRHGLRSWCSSDVQMEPSIGGTITVGFFKREIVLHLRIDRLEPYHTVSWAIVDPAPAGLTGTQVTFEIRAKGDSSDLLLTHSGFATANDDFARAAMQWALHLVSLAQFVETGEGEPKS